MLTEIKKLYLSADYETTDSSSADIESTDVIVLMSNGDKRAASFFSYEYIKAWEARQKDAEENLNGRLFWVPNMVIVDKCTKESIIEIVQHLIDEGDFKTAFRLLEK